jgi:hypothetical protein
MVESLGLLILILTNYISGYSLYKIFFRKTNILEKIILPQVFSLILTPVIFVLIYLILGFDLAVYISPVVIIATAIICARIKQKSHKIQIKRRFFLWIIVLLIGMSFIILYRYFYEFPSASGDLTWFISLANEIKNLKTLPPVDPCLYGTRSNYQWFWLLIPVIISVYSNYSIFQIIPFFSIYIVSLFLAMLYILLYHYFKDTNLAIVTATIFLLALFGTVAVHSGTYMLPLIMLFLYSLVLFLETKSNKFAFLTGVIAASFIYFHGFSFTFAALTLFAYLLYKIVFEFDKFYKFNKKEILQIIILLAPMVLAIPYYLIIKNAAGEVFLFEPFTNLLNSYLITKVNFLLIFLPFSIAKMIKTKNETMLVFLSLTIALFVVANTFVMERSPNIERYLYFMIIPIGFITIDYLRDLSSIKRNAIFTIVILLLLYQFLSDAFLASYHHPTKNILESDEYFASKWINQNTGKDETILVTSQIGNGTVYTALSERKAVLCFDLSIANGLPHTYFNGMPFPVSDIKNYFADVILMYTHPSQDRFLKYNISYVLYCDSERSFFQKYDLTPYDFQKSSAFYPVFNRNNCAVYKVSNLQKLPASINESAVNGLNFTKYSKWWSI